MTSLSERMKHAQLTLAHTNHAGDLDATDTLNRIVKALPKECRIQWARLTARQHLSGERASFRDLCCFVEEEALVRRGQYGKFIQNEDNERRESRPNPEIIRRSNGRPYTTYGRTHPTCPICQGTHRTEECSEFLKLSAFDRMKRAREKGL